MAMFNRLFGKSSGLSENEKRNARASQSYSETVKAVVEKGIPTEGEHPAPEGGGEGDHA